MSVARLVSNAISRTTPGVAAPAFSPSGETAETRPASATGAG
jgi:hypothetical protein